MHFVRRPFAFPRELDEALLRYFWHGRLPGSGELRSMSARLKKLWPLLAKQRGQEQGPKHYSFDSGSAEAYAAYYLPANAMKVPLILEEMFISGLKLAAGGGRLRWADFGSGPGTAFWGLSWWARHRGLEFEFRGYEQSQNFVKLAGGLASELGASPQSPSWGFGGARWEVFRFSETALLAAVREANPHVVSMMNSIGEMAVNGSERLEMIRALVGCLGELSRKDGLARWLVLIEPGSQASTRELLELRRGIVEKAPGNFRLWLPCLSARPCGALERPEDWCHEEAACVFPEWMDRLGAEAGLRKEAVLFSYLVCSVGGAGQDSARVKGDGVRVVSQMLREKGLTQCYLCTASGKTKARVLNSRQNEVNAGFVDSVRGQIFDSVELDAKGDVLGFKQSELTGELDATVFPPLR